MNGGNGAGNFPRVNQAYAQNAQQYLAHAAPFSGMLQSVPFMPDARSDIMSGANLYMDQDKQKAMEASNRAEYLRQVKTLLVGRGENKQSLTSAQQSGIFPNNPYLFNKEALQAIPYQKVAQDWQALSQTMKGFVAEDPNDPKTSVDTKAQILSQLLRENQLYNSDIDNTDRGRSIFEDIPRDPTINLANLQIRKARENNFLNIL